MKIFLSLILLLSFSAMSQSPQGLSFQGVARDASGKVIPSQAVGIRFTVRQTNAGGPIQYQEVQSATTGSSGVFAAVVGEGNPVSGEFSSIKWANDKYFLQVEIDPAGGNAFADAGTSQLLSVPYALHAKEATSWQNDQPVVQTGVVGQGGMLTDVPSPGTRLIWYPRLGAFRAGEITNDAWNVAEIGSYSIGLGKNTRAVGSGSVAIGRSAEALVSDAIALGHGVSSKNHYSVTLGAFNNGDGFPSNSTDANDRIFQLGNGSGENDRRNAITVLRKGNVGVGVLYPGYILDINGRQRIKHTSGNTAGLFLDGTQTDDYNIGPAAFIGMVNDNQVGFYIGDAWRFYVHANGNATLGGTLTQNSDYRLKKDLVALPESRAKLMGITGYNYHWKSNDRQKGLQTGLIAQEVEKLLPELVETDGNGYKSVNYIGLIPHLIEAFKALQTDYQAVKQVNQALESRVKLLEYAQP
ncbi:Chaperone of endosialidase [Dyadobacter soli]|uniref:Chaperone of endosialidase n=1 Tax=Dyadobacter soli TaxID=659014 RepID=A0A1G7BSG9_9BACT|nr:tail fiber domain-containing protein [Dyadobacter soli]SDE29892.1 Chaperone of endosialidase [Dyadobacter soli]